MTTSSKIEFEGTIMAAQPRIRLTRSYDERWHDYLGYTLTLVGDRAGEKGSFTVGIGKAMQAKHALCPGMAITGSALPVPEALEPWLDYYKVSRLKVTSLTTDDSTPPPFGGPPPPLTDYRARGHRRLAKQTYTNRCHACLWGARMQVTIILDKWNNWRQRQREETFCYGPRSCPWYRAGPTRKVPIHDGPSWEEEDWVDDDNVAHRTIDE